MREPPLSARRNYPFDPALNLGFRNLGLELDFTLVTSITAAEAVSQIKGKKVYLDLEEPNRFLVEPAAQRENPPSWDSYLTICPYSQRFFASRDGRHGAHVFFPVDAKRVPRRPTNQAFDLVYSGHLVNRQLIGMLERLSRSFRVAVVSNSAHPLVTHRGLNYDEKLELVSRSKLALVHNKLWLQPRQVKHLKSNLVGWRKHGAFAHLRNPLSLDQNPAAPQIKSRLFEAAFCGAVPVVIEDNWNLALRYFSTEEVFLTTDALLESRVHKALYDQKDLENRSKLLREKAFELYTTSVFAEKFLVPLSA